MKKKEKTKKDCMFQYSTSYKMYENTELITRKEAEELWDKYQEHLKQNWDEYSKPEMCIWIDCDSNIDYSTVGKDIDFRDCVYENGQYYRVTKERIQ